MSTYRNRPQRDFVMIRNAALRDPRLTLKAKGLLALMLTFPADWTYRQSHLVKQSADGRDAVRTAVRELVDAGYIIRKRERRKDGTLGEAVYYVSDEVSSTDGKSNVGEPNVGESVPTNTESYEDPVDEVQTSPRGDAPSSARPYASKAPAVPSKTKRPTNADAQLVLDAYNAHRGPLPAAQVLNSTRARKIKRLIADLGSAEEAASAMAVAASEVANDSFWQKNRYGLNNLLSDQRVIQKAETAVSRGTTDRKQAETDRLLAAIGGP